MFRLRAPTSLGPIGVDLAAGGVKMLQLREAHGTVERVAAARLAAGPDDPGLAAAIRAALASEGFRGDRCVLSLARQDAFADAIRVPAGAPSELEAAALQYAARRLGVDSRRIEVRVTTSEAALHGPADEVELLLTATDRDVVRARLATLAEAGLRPVAVETSAPALARFGLGHGPGHGRADDQWESTPCAILDVGAAGSALVIARDGAVVRVRPIATGTHDIDRALQRRLRGDAGTNGGIARLRRAGVDAHPAVVDALRPFIRLIAGEVRLALRSYGSAFRGAGPDRIILMGGGSRVPGLATRIASTCGVPVGDDETGDLARVLAVRPDAASTDAAQSWAVAIGLARRSDHMHRKRVERTAA